MSNLPPVPPSPLGGRYELLREVGRGGAAVVYAATDISSGQLVAVKVLRAEIVSAVGHQRFLREIEMGPRLRHPHIVDILEFGESDGFVWYVMPFIEGGTLRQYLQKEAQLRTGQVVQWGMEIAGALAFAHARGYVHRDVKPENILLDGPRAILGDFGIARSTDADTVEALTSTGVAIGTPAYMSPEQGSADKACDGRSDVYSLACVLYECLAGVPPFVGPNAQSIISQRYTQKPHPLSSYRTTIPAHVADAISSAMSLAPADRPTAAEFEKLLSGEGLSITPGSVGRIGSGPLETLVAGRSNKRRMVTAAGALALTGLLAITLVRAVRERAVLHSLSVGRVVAFPPTVLGDQSAVRYAAGVPSSIGAALQEVKFLRVIEGNTLAGVEVSGDSPSGNQQRIVAARKAGAAYLIDGVLQVSGDSIEALLRLRDAASDSVIARGTARMRGGASDAQAVALRAVGQLLPRLIAPGVFNDPAVFLRAPINAIIAVLLGDLEFRQSRYDLAFARYQQAMSDDSTLAIAALKASLSTRSLLREPEARRLVNRALAHPENLPGATLPFARGLYWHYAFQSDSAISELDNALRIAPTWSEAHAISGDVYFYSSVDGVDTDSAAVAQYRQAWQLDSSSTRLMYHRIWLAARRGDTTSARTLLRQYVAAGSPDTSFATAAAIAINCEVHGPAAIGWALMAVNTPAALRMMAKVITGRGNNIECGDAAARAVLARAGEATQDDYSAFMVLNGIAMMTGDTAALSRLKSDPKAAALYAGYPLLFDALADSTLALRVDSTVREMMTNLSSLPTELRWLVGAWVASQGRPTELSTVIRDVERRHRATASDSAMLESLKARQYLLNGDTTRALAALNAVSMDMSFQDVEWGFFYARSADNMLRAAIALRRGQARPALRFASRLDQPYAMANLVFLRQSLELRIAAARVLGDAPLVSRLRARLLTPPASRNSR